MMKKKKNWLGNFNRRVIGVKRARVACHSLITCAKTTNSEFTDTLLCDLTEATPESYNYWLDITVNGVHAYSVCHPLYADST
jgi:hypothetical protein